MASSSSSLGPADERLASALPVLRDAFGQARAFLAQAKRRSRVLDFADLEVHALRALEHEEVRDYYRERWRAFLVDEFQDTNPVQAELLDLLTQGAKLTVVGDEKQSIYGFRRADVEVFRRFRERILSEGGEEVVLATSFRGHSELVRVLNAVFSSVLGEMRQDLEAHREEPPHEAPHVRALRRGVRGEGAQGPAAAGGGRAHRAPVARDAGSGGGRIRRYRRHVQTRAARGHSHTLPRVGPARGLRGRPRRGRHPLGARRRGQPA